MLLNILLVGFEYTKIIESLNAPPKYILNSKNSNVVHIMTKDKHPINVVFTVIFYKTLVIPPKHKT